MVNYEFRVFFHCIDVKFVNAKNSCSINASFHYVHKPVGQAPCPPPLRVVDPWLGESANSHKRTNRYPLQSNQQLAVKLIQYMAL